MPPSRPQSPTAITNLGSGVASQVRRSASAMFRVTGPVTSRQSAWRGEATKCRPNRSRSQCGPVRPAISSSQPLQEPASTCRMWRDRPKRRRMSVRRRSPTRSSSEVRGAGSATMPVWSARRSWRSTASAPAGPRRLAPEGAQHRLGVDQLAVEDPPGDVEQLADQWVAHGVAHGRALLARADDVLAAQHGELGGHGRLVEVEGGLELLYAPLAPAQGLEDADADRVREGLEELRLERLQLVRRRRLGHGVKIYRNIFI